MTHLRCLEFGIVNHSEARSVFDMSVNMVDTASQTAQRRVLLSMVEFTNMFVSRPFSMGGPET